MTRIAYLDCFSGVSGDMLLGALVGAGLDFGALRTAVAGLGLEGYELTAEPVLRAGIAATKVTVSLTGPAPPQRRLSDILAIIEGSRLTGPDKEQAAEVFRRLAEAEARVHGVDPEAVHFHEVGAVDAIVDVVGTVAGLRLLGVDTLYCSSLPAGGGFARGAHGVIPVPAPATMELLASVNAPISAPAGEERSELVTPTGAAIVTTLAHFERPAMTLRSVGYGAGGRDPAERPNVLRLWLGDAIERPDATMLVIETNLDDTPAEVLGYVQERLFEAGAADVWFLPAQMKKNRPATLVSVICAPEREDAVVSILMRETTTLGVRVHEVRRHELQREIVPFESTLGPARYKVKHLDGAPPRVKPEYEDCRRLALEHNLPLSEVYRILTAEADQHLRDA
jgi:uncharacterized protein (TIGR00299 family) protein